MKKQNCFQRAILLLVCAGLLTLAGCATYNEPMTGGQAYLPPISGFAEDLQDIEIPTDLEWIYDQSMAIKTESFHGGIWHYSGNVEVISLKNFMINAMKNNKWKLVGEASSKQILLAFVKPNKNCMVVISEAYMGETAMTLYVTIDQTAAAGLNPFGEAVGPPRDQQ